MKTELKLSALHKVVLVCLVVALVAVSSYLSLTIVGLPGVNDVPAEAKEFLTVMAIVGAALGGLITFLINWGIGLLVIKLSDQGKKEALFLALVIANCVIAVLNTSYLLLGGALKALSWFNILQLGIFGGSYYQLSQKDQRGTLYLVGVYAIFALLGFVLGGFSF